VKKKVLAAVIALAGVITLTSCGQVTSAAIIGKTEISVATVQKGVDQILADRKGVDLTGAQIDTGAALNRAQLRFFLISYILDQVAAEKKITVTPAEIAAVRTALVNQVGGEAKIKHALIGAGLTADEFPTYIRGYVIQTKISQLAKAAGIPNTNGEAIQALVVAYTKGQKITINPRYGVWDAANANIIDAPSTTAPVTTTK